MAAIFRPSLFLLCVGGGVRREEEDKLTTSSQSQLHSAKQRELYFSEAVFQPHRLANEADSDAFYCFFRQFTVAKSQTTEAQSGALLLLLPPGNKPDFFWGGGHALNFRL